MELNIKGDTIADLIAVKVILETLSGNGSDDKNVLFMFSLEITYPTNESFRNFSREHIIDHQIMPNILKSPHVKNVGFFSAKYLIRWKTRLYEAKLCSSHRTLRHAGK